MRSRKQRKTDRDAETTLRYLKLLHYAMQARIDAGDFDFDDTIYRTRDAAATLISIREPEWTPEVTKALIAKHGT